MLPVHKVALKVLGWGALAASLFFLAFFYVIVLPLVVVPASFALDNIRLFKFLWENDNA